MTTDYLPTSAPQPPTPPLPVNVQQVVDGFPNLAPKESPAFTGTPTGLLKSHVDLGNVDNTADMQKPVSTLQQQAITQVRTLLLDGVPDPGNSLQKLYNLLLGSINQVNVPNIAARNSYSVQKLPLNVFVTDDGDGKWALYGATSTGINATYVKLSDPDLLNALMSAAQIQAAYESNPDTFRLTGALVSDIAANKAAVAALPTGTMAQLAQSILNALPGYDQTVAQFATHDANGGWRAAAVSTGGGTPTPQPDPQPALLTASKTDLSTKDRQNLTIGGTGVDRFVRGQDGVGWQTGGNVANFSMKPTAGVDWLFEASIRSDSAKAAFSMFDSNDKVLSGYGLNGGTSIAVMSDGRLFVNKGGTETYLGISVALGSTKTVKLALVGSGTAVSLYYTTDGTTYTKVSAFTFTNSASIFFGLAMDGASALYNLQQIGLATF